MTISNPERVSESDVLLAAPATQSGSWRIGRDAVAIGLLVAGLLLPSAAGLYNKFEQLVYILLSIGLLSPMLYGRVYYVLFVLKPASRWLRLNPGGFIWRFDARKIFQRHAPYPLAGHYVSLGNDETLGLLHDPAGKIDGIVITGDGFDLVSSELEEQVDLTRELARIAKELTSVVKGYSIGIGLSHGRRPLNRVAVTTPLAELLHADVKRHWIDQIEGREVADSELSRDDLCDKRVAQSMASLVAKLDEDANEVPMTIVLMVYRDSLLAKMQRTKRKSVKPLTERNVYGLNVVRLARIAVTKLEALGIKEARFLDRQQAEDYNRGSWDANHIHEYRAGQLPYQQPGAKDVDNPESETDNEKNPAYYPHDYMAVVREPDKGQLQAVADGTYHGVLMITHMEELQGPYYLRSLYTLPIPYYTVTLVGTTLRANKDVWLLELSGNVSEALREFRQVSNPSRSMRRRDKLRNNQADQLDESAYQLSHNIFLHVMATSSDELEDGLQIAVEHLEGRNNSPVRVDEESVIWRAVVSAGTGFNLL